MHVLTLLLCTLRVAETGLIGSFLPREKGGVHVQKPTFTVLSELTFVLKTTETVGFWVVTLNCSSVKMVEEDLHTNRR